MGKLGVEEVNIDFKKIGKLGEKEQKRLDKLRFKSEDLSKLVLEKDFVVEDVYSQSYSTRIMPRSEMVIGGKSASYNGGFISKLILKVIPKDKKIPVRTLNFLGNSIVQSGHNIRVKIPRYEEKKMSFLSISVKEASFYFPRNFKSEESAIELIIISPEGKILRRDRAVDYSKFSQE